MNAISGSHQGQKIRVLACLRLIPVLLFFCCVFCPAGAAAQVLGPELVVNGDFSQGSTGWTGWNHVGSVSAIYDSVKTPNGGSAPSLEMIAEEVDLYHNGGVYQALSLSPGQPYVVSVLTRDLSVGHDIQWTEVQVGEQQPQNGQDYPATGSNATTRLQKWDTLTCDNWNGTPGCVQNETAFIATSATMYLVLKCGGVTTMMNASFDNISVRQTDTFPATKTPTLTPTVSPTPVGANMELSSRLGGYCYSVASDGRYIFMGEGQYLSILDTAQAPNPTLVADIFMGGLVRDLVLSGPTLYVAAGPAGLNIVNLADPLNPEIIGNVERANGDAIGVALSGDIACVAFMGAPSEQSGILFLNVANPSSPVSVYFHKMSILSLALDGGRLYATDGRNVIIMDPTSPGKVLGAISLSEHNSVEVSYPYAIIASYRSGFSILDVSNPQAPRLRGSIDLPGGCYNAISGGTSVITFGEDLSIVDIADPDSPVLTAMSSLPGYCTDGVVTGDRAYVASFSDGVQIVDLSNRLQPVRTGEFSRLGSVNGIDMSSSIAAFCGTPEVRFYDRFDLSNPRVTGSTDHLAIATDIVLSGTIAYVMEYESGLKILNVSDTSHPRLLGSLPMEKYIRSRLEVVGSTCYITNATGVVVIDCSISASPVQIASIAVSGPAMEVCAVFPFLYVAAGHNGLTIVDISEPSKPLIVGNSPTRGILWDVSVSRNIAFTADRDYGLRIFDVSDALDPVQIGFVGTSSSIGGVDVDGTLAFISEGSGLVTVMDVSNPATPSQLGFYNLGGALKPVVVQGRTACIGDLMHGGAYIVEYTGDIPPTPVPTSTPVQQPTGTPTQTPTQLDTTTPTPTLTLSPTPTRTITLTPTTSPTKTNPPTATFSPTQGPPTATPPAVPGKAWVRATGNAAWPRRYGHTSLSYAGRMWLLGGITTLSNPFVSDVWYSWDGKGWTRATAGAPWEGRGDHASVVFDNKMWILGGLCRSKPFLNDVWHSTDGVNWVQATANAPWTARRNPSAVVHDGKIWIMGGADAETGYLNDVWSSSDGTNWELVTASAPWLPRVAFTLTEFKGRMWVMSGVQDNTGLLNDVWSSSDGIHWTEETSSANWPARSWSASVVHDNELWILGGFLDRNDVWHTPDGVNWTQTIYSTAWLGRGGHTALVHDGRIWVAGGAYGYTTRLGDVYYSEDFLGVTPTPTLTPTITPTPIPPLGYYMLDGWGTLWRSPWTLPGPKYGYVDGEWPWFGWDVTRGFAVSPELDGFYMLDGYGTIWPNGTTTDITYGAGHLPWFGYDIASDIEVSATGEGLLMLDAHGLLYTTGDYRLPDTITKASRPYFWFDASSGSQAPIILTMDGDTLASMSNGTPAYDFPNPLPGQTRYNSNNRFLLAAEAVAVHPNGKGLYILDSYGGIHPVGDVPAVIAPIQPYFGWNVARDLVLTPHAEGAYVLDGWGGVHTIGSAAPPPYFGENGLPYFPKYDVARGLQVIYEKE